MKCCNQKVNTYQEHAQTFTVSKALHDETEAAKDINQIYLQPKRKHISNHIIVHTKPCDYNTVAYLYFLATINTSDQYPLDRHHT